MEGKNGNSIPNSAMRRRRAPCSSCRRRKSRCDNRQPQCSTCIAHNSQCSYEGPPSLAYVRGLEAKIDTLMKEKDLTGSSETLVDVGYDTNVRKSFASTFEDGSQPSNPSYQGLRGNRENIGHRDRWASEISVDSQGGVCYHNPTSAIHEAPSSNGHDSSYSLSSTGIIRAASEDPDQHINQVRYSWVSNAAAQNRFEALAMEKMSAIQSEVSGEMANEFLRYHWCWIHPMFMFVYRPAFTRDLALSSPGRPETTYFSETLLKVLLAHSSRFRVRNHQYQDSASALMNELTKQAHMSLALRLTEPSSIPTVQALLQQSAREIAFGNSSQAWLYSGMAFRIAVDIGIHLPSDKLRGYVKSLSVEDIEIRKRLFWSCYTWDKAISLYLGRMPAFNSPVESHEPKFMDDFTENDSWKPFYAPNAEQNNENVTIYPEHRGHMISCFTGLCKISKILNTIMLEIYGSAGESRTDDHSAAVNGAYTTTPSRKTSSFVKISKDLQKWRTELPGVICLDTKNLPAISPPLHIVSLNLLYHTTTILLHRPFIIGATQFESPATQRSYQICIAATASMHDLLELLTSTFGHGHTTYLNCYSTYIAATIAVLHFQLQEEGCSLPLSDISEEKLELKFFLNVLQKSATGMPALTRSIEIVKRHMQMILDKRAKRYLESLFPASSIGERAVSSGYPAASGLSNKSLDQSESFGLAPTDSNEVPMYSQASTGGDFQVYSGFNLEGLPAFPGQHFNVGADFNLDQEILNSDIRIDLSGLDSHLTLQHENFDYDYGSFYLGDEIQ